MAKNIQVLYVDDESALLELCKVFLECLGEFTVTTAQSAPEALRILELKRFDAIVSDYQMPEMNGIEFLKVVRARGDKTPVVIFTGKGREDVVIEALNSGADFYIQKGGEPKSQFAELAHKIRRAVEHQTDEKALMESEERFRALVENTSDIIRILDREGRIIFDTAAAGRELGYPPGYTLGRHPSEFIHPDDLAMVKQELSEVYAKTNTGIPTEFRIRKADGSYVWVESVGKNLIGVPGVDGVVITTRIIDERKKAEEARRESEEKFRQLFSKMPSGVAIYEAVDAGEDFVFRDFNTTAEAIEHIKKEKTIGRRVSEVFPGVKEFGLFSVFQRVWRTGKPEFFPQAVYQDDRDPGTWRENWVYQLQTGEIVAIYNDITERKVAEQALKKSQEQLAEAMDLAHMVNWEFDVASGIFTFNDRFYSLYGTTAEREGGYQMPAEVYAREFVHPDEVSLVANEVQNAITATDPNYTRQIEHRIVRRDGEIRHITVRFGITKDARGRTVKTHGANQDITEQIRTKVEIQRLLANVSQEKERLSSLINSITDEVWFADTDGRFTLANPTALREFHLDGADGIDVETLAKSLEVLRPDGSPRPADEAPPLRALAGEVVRLQEEIVRTPATGELRYRQVSAAPVRDDKGTIIGSISVVRDITDRKKAEESLRESEDKYRSLFEHMAAGCCVDVVIYDGGKAVDYRILDVNSAYERILGINKSQAIGALASQLYGTGKAPFLDAYSKVAETGEPTMFDAWFEPSQKYLHITVSCPETGRFSTVFTDITDREKAEQSLHEAALRWQSTFDSTQDAICIVDADQRIITCNHAMQEIVGTQSADDLVGKHCWEVVHQTTGSVPDCPFVRMRDSHQREQMELKIGKRLFVVTVDPILDETQTLVGAVHNIRDITERKRAEEALRESEERYREFFTTSRDCVFITSPEGQWIDFNDALVEMFGFESREELSKVSISSLYANLEERSLFIQLIERERHVKENPILLKQKDGTIIDTIITTETVRNPDGSTKAFIGTIRDITGHKRAEEELKGLSRSLADAMNLAKMAIWEYDVAKETFTFNDALYAMHGMTVEDAGGYQMSARTFAEKYTVPAYARQVFDTVRQALESSDSHFELTVEGELKRQDGTTFWVVTWFRAERDASGNVVRLHGVNQDITERKRAEEALRESESFNRGLVENLPDYIAIYGPDGKILYVNPASATVLGYSAEKLVGTPVLSYVAEEYRDVVISMLADRHEAGEVPPYEIEVLTHDGLRSSVIVKGTQIQYRNTPATLLVLTDITERKRAEAALKESEERFRGILETMEDGYIRGDREGIIQMVNPAAACLFGYGSVDEMIGIPMVSLYRDAIARDTVIQTMQKYGIIHDCTIEVVKKDGTSSWVSTNGRMIYDNQGNFAGTEGFNRDITDRKRTETELQTTKRRLTDIINSLPDPMFVIDNTGTVTAWNYAMEDLTGVSAAEMVGKGNYAYAIPFYGERRKILIDLASQYDENEIAKYSNISFEGKTLVGDTTIATPRAKNAILWGKATRLYDDDGNAIGAVEVIRDITEKKHAEQEILTLQQFQQSIIHNAKVWISVLDPKGTILVWNNAAEEISGYLADDVIGKNTIWKQLYPDPVYRKQVAENILDIIKKNAFVENFETRIRTKSGNEKIIWWNTQPLRDTSGKPVQFIAIGQDNTERKRAEDALRQANKQLNLLSDITRHDILNQLLVLRGYLELSHDVIDKPEALKEYIKKEQQAANTIDEQITFTRDYQNLGVAAPAWQNVNARIRNAMVALPLRAVHIEPDPADPEVYSDPLFEKVFYNLIDNALRYGGSDLKTIRFSSKESDTSLEIVCEDDGVGITDEDKKKLFRKGFGKHTGLGLFLSREILAITGIGITENGVPGKGARFEITVPKGGYRFTGTGGK